VGVIAPVLGCVGEGHHPPSRMVRASRDLAREACPICDAFF